MERAGDAVDRVMESVTEKLAQNVQARTTTMLENLLPDGCPDDFVGAVLAGMAGAIILDLWDRCPGGPGDVDRLSEAWRNLGESIIGQLRDSVGPRQ